MERRASDNEYLHKDFHGALSCALDYLSDNYGEEAVRDYLRKFTRSFYAQLIADIKTRGLIAIKEHYEKVYQIEGGKAEFNLTGDELAITVEKCPAITHLRENSRTVSPLFYETTRTVNEALCEGTPFASELLDYDAQTGAGIQRFFRRAAI
jgi:hypothetical protein